MPEKTGAKKKLTREEQRDLDVKIGFMEGVVKRDPARLKPDSTTTVVCGFCSTGCGLNIHLKNGEAVNLSPDTHYPVNLGMACPKGWESLTPLDAADRGTTPLLRAADGTM